MHLAHSKDCPAFPRAVCEEAMETNIHLMSVIQEMRAEINKLEKENHTLRVKLTSVSKTATGSGGESKDEREERVCGRSLATLPDDVPTTSSPAMQEHQGNVMIVRRYSISPPVHPYAAKDAWKARSRLPNVGIVEVQGTITSPPCSLIKRQDSEEKTLAAGFLGSNSFSPGAPPDHDFACRDKTKTKTVSFHLPRNMSSFSKNSCSLKYSAEHTANQLSIIVEKDV